MNGVSKSARPDASWCDKNTFMLEATSGKDYINLFIDSTSHSGTFRLYSPHCQAPIEYKVGNNELYYLDSGTLFIRSSDGDRAQGSFYDSVGNGPSKIDITEGTFNVKSDFYSTSDTSYYNHPLFNVIRRKQLMIHGKKIAR